MAKFFTWDIDPVILQIYGPFGIRWYSLLFLTGFLIGHQIFKRMCVAEGKDPELADTLLYYVVFGTIIGARLGHCLFYDPIYYLSNPLRILQTWEGGLASHGGYLGVLIGMMLFARRYKSMPFFWIADRVAIASILGGAFIRMGNFFNSEIIGKPSELPWAIIFSRVDQIPRHPAQIYEALGYALLSLSMYWLYRWWNRKPLEGRILGLIFIIGFVHRFLIEQLKENQEAFEDALMFNMGQLLSIPFILLGICLAIGMHHQWRVAQWGLSSAVTETHSETSPSNSKKRRRSKTKA